MTIHTRKKIMYPDLLVFVPPGRIAYSGSRVDRGRRAPARRSLKRTRKLKTTGWLSGQQKRSFSSSIPSEERQPGRSVEADRIKTDDKIQS